MKKLLWIGMLFLTLLALAGCASTGDDSYDETSTTELNADHNSSSQAGSTEEFVTETVETDWDGCTITTDEINYDPSQEPLDEDGYYTTETDIATYLIEYRTLPDNFITKKEAKKEGWTGGSLEDYGENLCIGGDYFGNYEGLLPQVKGRKYYECDVDTMGAKKRGAKRIIYSDDGQIYYTDDHYESFSLIYGSDQ